jgi:NAD(P)H dehydrogenase (quinone)
MRTIETISPIPYRRQNFGDYLIPTMQLRPEIGSPDVIGFSIHQE